MLGRESAGPGLLVLTPPTRNIDLLGRIDNDLEAVRAVIAKIGEQKIDPDGLIFDPAGVATERIAEDAGYHGVRAQFRGRLGNARIAMQIDIGFSDVLTPGPVEISYPTILVSLGRSSTPITAKP